MSGSDVVSGKLPQLVNPPGASMCRSTGARLGLGMLLSSRILKRYHDDVALHNSTAFVQVCGVIEKHIWHQLPDVGLVT
jgi:hypothetical protein